MPVDAASILLSFSGIWLVKDEGEELRPVTIYNYLRWPARELATRESAAVYEKIVALAETVDGISQLSRTDAVMALDSRVSNENPYISSWAISRLSNGITPSTAR